MVKSKDSFRGCEYQNMYGLYYDSPKFKIILRRIVVVETLTKIGHHARDGYPSSNAVRTII